MNTMSMSVLVAGAFLLGLSQQSVAAENGKAATIVAQGGIVVVRGVGPERPVRPVADVQSATVPELMGGDKIWIVDRESGKLIGCRLERTMNVGQRRVRCGSRTLRALSGS